MTSATIVGDFSRRFKIWPVPAADASAAKGDGGGSVGGMLMLSSVTGCLLSGFRDKEREHLCENEFIEIAVKAVGAHEGDRIERTAYKGPENP